MNVIKEIEKAITESAQKLRDDAGYGGRMDDGGASHKLELLKYWLDGINYARNGTTVVYNTLIKNLEQEQDPEYKEWKRLNEKFKP
jgi:hypothetical protein